MTRRAHGLRLAGAGLAGLIALAAVLTASLGDVLLAFGHADLASRLPGNAPLLARVQLPLHGERPATATSRAAAVAALETAPLSSAGLVHLSLDARLSGDPVRAQRLLTLAGATGWHDEFAQRQLYNAAIRRNDAAAAMRHAEALLRQGKGRDELFATFDRGVQIAPFRTALGKAMAGPTVWPIDYLVSRGARLPDAVLLELVGARAGKAPLELSLAGPLVYDLVRAGRLDAAASLWRMARAPSGEGQLDWASQATDGQGAGPFSWHSGDGYRIEYGDDRLTAVDPLPGATTSRLLALPPGQWRLEAQSATTGWRWSVGCARGEGAPMRPLGRATDFTAAADCPVQRLVLAASPLGGIAVEPLAPLRLLRVD